MPATEQTWRNQKQMHVIFGASALVMAIATLWMLAKDHNREWKKWQLADRKKEAWMLRAQRDSLADQFTQQKIQLQNELRRVKGQAIDPRLVEEFKSLVTQEDERLQAAGIPSAPANFTKLDQALKTLRKAAQIAAETGDQKDKNRDFRAAQEVAINAREKVFKQFSFFVHQALRREDKLVADKQFMSADRTAAVSELGLKVGEGADSKQLAKVQSRIDELDRGIADLTEKIALVKGYRTGLESLLKRINAQQTALEKKLTGMKTDLARLDEQVYKDTTNLGEWITRWPVLNALYNGNIRINQIWLPKLTINYNFAQVARFDRCKTCHRAISQTASGTATEPAYPTLPKQQRKKTISLATPDAAPESNATLKEVYGLVLAKRGIVHYADVTVHYVVPESPAAQAGLESGDVIRRVGDAPVYEPEAVAQYLLHEMHWGEPATLAVLRGLPHPFTSHPRLDLYLTDSSPHPEKVVGCTICHDGQGSGTEFPWTSHTPNDAEQQVEWTRKHGWFDNHNWIFPMKPARFAESNCTKCHYDKASLEPSERFPDPPAPKLVEGWTLVERYGCFGCHEIGGYDGPDKRIGPDLRLEPNYSEVAAQILRDDGLTDELRTWAETLVHTPDNDLVRHQLSDALKQDARLASKVETRDQAKLTSATQKLASSLKDVEVPGQYRKVGPSLRFLQSKVDFQWVYNWIKKPSNYSPKTRMPQYFGQWEHLQDDPEELAVSQRFEPVEIRALAEFLLSNSSQFEYLSPPREVTEAPSVERGKWLFESRGCLACHSHEAFPGIHSDQGPNLSRVGAKLNTEKGARWLYSWIKQPQRYHVRTKMPELFLTPIEEKDATGKPTGKITDPAADIAAFLLGTSTDWRPADTPANHWSPEEQQALADLAVEWLTSDAIPKSRAKKFVQEGIPAHLGLKLKADEHLLLGITDENRVDRLREYVARRTIGKYGCFGCHDIPGFEDAKSIGTSLADWGRKKTTRLAFENIHKFLEGPGRPGADKHQNVESKRAQDSGHVGHEHLDPSDFDSDTSYFIQSLNSHGRDGFIWQKLRMPRSYDYKTTKNKGYNERLRMPRFSFNAHQREAIITFVLGLVNEPPAEQFVYRPDARQQAIVEGKQVLEKFHCAGCHTLHMEQWQFAFQEGQFDAPSEVIDYPFLDKRFSEKEVAASLKKDTRGKLHATLHGLPVLNEKTGQPERYDEDGLPLEPDDDESEPYYLFTLWRDALVEGQPRLVGLENLMIPAKREDYGPADGKTWPAWGGVLPRYLFPRVIAHAQQSNPQVKGSEAWGWLPPPLMVEGEKVQPDWLHDFLMDPTSIRPAVVMRMPNFHMSADDASKLVNYFAAASDVEFPYEYNPRRRARYLAQIEQGHPKRLEAAMNVVVNGNYCVKCHAVDDFSPVGEPTALGPNLANVYRRLRPEYARDWIANPKRILPYTGMPVNVPYKPGAPHLGGVAQDLFPGTSIQQLDGLVDLLMNFDVYAKRQTSIAAMVKAATPEKPQASNAGGEDSPRR